MHIQMHTHTSTYVQSAHKRNGDNQAQEPGWEGRKKGFVRDLAHTHTKTKSQKKPIFTNLKKRFEHIELPAKLLDYFLRSNNSNINQFRTLTKNKLWICPGTEPLGLCPWFSTALVVGPFEEEEEGIGIVSDVVKVDLSNSISSSIAEWYKAIIVRISFGTVTWVRFPPTGKRTAIMTWALSRSFESS